MVSKPPNKLGNGKAYRLMCNSILLGTRKNIAVVIDFSLSIPSGLDPIRPLVE
jgi:hypothetical protein